jgi:glucan phosphorylase
MICQYKALPDLLKSASDLNLPLVGIGLLYQQGYFRQLIDAQGVQQAFFPYNEPASLPIRPALDKLGNRLTIVLELWVLLLVVLLLSVITYYWEKYRRQGLHENK